MKSETSIVFEKLVYGGDALGRMDGQVLLAPYGLAGETAQVEITSRGRGLLRGRILEVVSPSPERVTPGCPYFARCGGCHYQQAGYEYQILQKREILRETIRRTAKIDPPDEIRTVSGPPWEYRNRVQLHFAGRSLGYYEAGTHRVCDVERCPIASPRINAAIASLRQMMRHPRWPRFVRSLELFTNERDVQVNVLDSGERRLQRAFFEWCGETMPGATDPALEYEAAATRFRVSHKSFFQVNRFLVDALVNEAIGDAAGDRAIELYAGVGLFSLELAKRFSHVTAVEWGASASADLEFNTRRAGVPLTVIRQTAEEFLESAGPGPDFLLVDPPRSGLGPGVVKQLARLKPSEIAIISCDPSTLARDLAGLFAADYRIEVMTLVDLFPQTCHIESVTHLRRN
jgi:23S rRNA (uracil1939-C5)-methyltransferase